MDDTEVTRQALSITFSSLARLEQCVMATKSDAEALRFYVELCPFIASESPALKAAMELLLNAPNGNRTTLMAYGNRKKASQTAIEATRVAMRITISSWSQLLVQSETIDDFEVMRRYIRQCPFVNDNSETKKYILEGLLNASNNSRNPLLSDNVQPAPPESETESKKSLESKDIEAKAQLKQATDTTISSTKRKSSERAILVLIRSIVLDLPMAVLFAAYLGLCWTHRVNQLYLQPAMTAAVWTDERAEQEITYYNRRCTAEDMTTKDARDLIIPQNATIQEAYEHQLLHGFSIFQGVLTDDVSMPLREYIVARNRKLTEEESIFVIEGDKRFSSGLGTEEPCVARAVRQIATHPKLAPALEKILGPSPALIELTAITSSYGAVDQYWHDDVIAAASVMKYGRSFGPSYSVFIQLQNTTRAMGATDACPGTHMCSRGDIEDFCDEEGFQAVNSDTGYWRAGDALVMNMNSYHRGTAHTDPNAQDRVMMILTFVPKPEARAESRQLSQGITFSLRADMWGHTLSDLARADTRMKQPWVVLRALGLYKPRDASWGVDYVSSAIMRMANEDNGFRRDELDKFLERGGFPWLPQFLQGQVKEGENWNEFLQDTLERCLEFVGLVNLSLVGVYGFCLVALFAVLPPQQFGLRGMGKSLLRSAAVYGLVLGLWLAANHHVDNTDWAKDIRAGRRYTVDFKAEKALMPALEHLPSTLPHRNDVLIETRYGSRELHMYNDFTNFHPGGRAFRELVRMYAFGYSQVQSEFFHNATASFVVDAIHSSQGRFLLQNQNEWRWLADDDAIAFVKKELALESNPFQKYMLREVRFLESLYKYATFRGTALSYTSLKNLSEWRKKFTTENIAIGPETNPALVRPVGVRFHSDAPFLPARRTLQLPSTMRSLPKPVTASRIFNSHIEPTEPEPGAWIKSGDTVEGTEFLEDGESHWYRGVVHKVIASGEFYVAYDDNSYGILTDNLVRAYEPYYLGEELEVLMDDDIVEYATIVADHGDGTYDVAMDDGELLRRVPTGDFRRPREDAVEEERVARNHYA